MATTYRRYTLCITYIYIYIYKLLHYTSAYMCIRRHTNQAWATAAIFDGWGSVFETIDFFSEMENNSPLVGLEPTTSRLHAGCFNRWATKIIHFPTHDTGSGDIDILFEKINTRHINHTRETAPIFFCWRVVFETIFLFRWETTHPWWDSEAETSRLHAECSDCWAKERGHFPTYDLRYWLGRYTVKSNIRRALVGN